MNIYLKNVGIVKESNIVIDGLTVITGKNNSGKTTVGKVLYSLIDAVADLKDKVAFDRRNYLNEQYIAVIDSESMEDYEDALSGLSNMKTTPTNSIGQVKNALSKLCRCKDCEGSPYYYDDIVVCSFQYFQSLLSQYS